jgi:hypothetical protein
VWELREEKKIAGGKTANPKKKKQQGRGGDGLVSVGRKN